MTSAVNICCSRFSLNTSRKCRENSAKERGLADSLLAISGDDPFFAIDESFRHEQVKPLYLMKSWEPNTENIWFQKAHTEAANEVPVSTSPKRSLAGGGSGKESLLKTPSKTVSLEPHKHMAHYRQTETEKNYTTKERFKFMTSDYRYQQQFVQTVLQLARIENESPQKRRAHIRALKHENRRARKRSSSAYSSASSQSSKTDENEDKYFLALAGSPTKRKDENSSNANNDLETDNHSPAGKSCEQNVSSVGDEAAKDIEKQIRLENTKSERIHLPEQMSHDLGKEMQDNFEDLFISFPSIPSSTQPPTDVSPTLTPDNWERGSIRGTISALEGNNRPPPLILPSVSSPRTSRSTQSKSVGSNKDDCISGDGRHMKTKASLTSAKIDTNQNSLSLSVTSTTDVPSRFYADKSSVTNRSHANFRTTRRSMSQITTTNTRRPIAIRPKRSSSSPRRLEELMTIKSCVIKTPVYTTQYDPINPSCHSWPNNPERYARARLQFAKIARNNSGKLKF